MPNVVACTDPQNWKLPWAVFCWVQASEMPPLVFGEPNETGQRLFGHGRLVRGVRDCLRDHWQQHEAFEFSLTIGPRCDLDQHASPGYFCEADSTPAAPGSCLQHTCSETRGRCPTSPGRATNSTCTRPECSASCCSKQRRCCTTGFDQSKRCCSGSAQTECRLSVGIC